MINKHQSKFFFLIKIFFLFLRFKFFFKNNYLCKSNFNKKISKKVFKKNIFFKKKFNIKILNSKRVSILLKKRKNNSLVKKLFFKKSSDFGNFFLKKFFFKILLKNRKNIKKFFWFNTKTRQTKVSRTIFSFSKKNKNNENFETSLINILLRTHIFLSQKDAYVYIKSKGIFVNNMLIDKPLLSVCFGDCIQLPVSTQLYNYILFFNKFIKTKINLFRMIS